MRIMNSIGTTSSTSRARPLPEGDTYPYVPAFDAHLFLAANPLDVRKALDAGHAAATILPSTSGRTSR